MPWIDLTSSLFLGRRHPRASLPTWTTLTTGVPAALGEPERALRVAARVADAQRAGAGLVARSSLHALIDVVDVLVRPGDVLAVDAAPYPIIRWAAALAAARGVSVRSYLHHRPGRGLRPPGGRGRVWFVAEGWCPGCNRPAPVRRLRDLARDADTQLILDDTLAFGVLGRRLADADGITASGGFGDGTGTPRWCGVRSEGIVWVASLAKAHGAALAVVTADDVTISRLARHGPNRLHSSPPTAADLAAADRSLADVRGGAVRRAGLAGHVHRLRERLAAAGAQPVGDPFPLVTVPVSAAAIDTRLRHAQRCGVRALAWNARCTRRPAIGVLLRADLSVADVDRAATALAGPGVTRAAHLRATAARAVP